jgi:plasmid maintenance system antidote protein VapI
MDSSYPEITKDISDKKQITPETIDKLQKALQTFNSSWAS